MIRLIENFDGSGLEKSHYSRVILSHLAAYGTGYDFCLFYEIVERKRIGVISVFNGSVTADLTDGARPSPIIRREIREFVDFQSPYSVELPAGLVLKSGFPGYKSSERRFFEVIPGETSDGLSTPDFDYVFNAISLPGDSYPLWLTDTAKRVNSGLSELIRYESSVLTVRFKAPGLAFVTDLATPEEDRGKGYAKELLRRTACRLKSDGYITYLAAKPSLWEFYEKVGCKTVGGDFIYLKKEN